MPNPCPGHVFEFQVAGSAVLEQIFFKSVE
jgi:hypothetical protein